MAMPNIHPQALLALWNDIDLDRTMEYNRWHTIEHVPERVWVPGFHSGTRYITNGGARQQYFTLYELESLDCLNSDAYKDLVNSPTPWSTSMRASFSNFLRKTGPIIAVTGNVQGSAIAVIRMVFKEKQVPDLTSLRKFTAEVMRQCGNLGVTRVRIQKVDAAGPQAFKNEDEAPVGVELLCIVETYASSLVPVLADLTDEIIARKLAPRPYWTERSEYVFLSQVQHKDVASADRPTPRIDLMPA